LPNGIKDLKTVKSRDPKPKKQTVANKKRVAAAILWIPLKANGSLPVPTRRCYARKCCPGSLLHILIKNRLYSSTAHSRTPPFPWRKNRCALATCGFAAVFTALNPLDYGIWGIVQPKGKATAHPKMGALK
jgi:hypothetical protein